MLRRLDAAKAQQASKIYTRSALTYKVSILFGFDYSTIELTGRVERSRIFYQN